MLKIKEFIEKDELVSKFAKEMARLQKKCDKFYYIDNDIDLCDYIQAQIDFLKSFLIRLGICEEVYKQAYIIYDFRDSGKEDYVPSEEKLKELRTWYDVPTDDF